jgi:hypothetical protein
MRFGKAGTQGYNTTLILEMKDNYNGIIINNLSYEKKVEIAILDYKLKQNKITKIEYDILIKDLETKYLFLEAEAKNIKYVVTGLPYDIKGNKLSPKLGSWEWSWRSNMTKIGTKEELNNEYNKELNSLNINDINYQEKYIRLTCMYDELIKNSGKPYIDIIIDKKNENEVTLVSNIPDINYLADKGFYGILEATYV